MFLRSRGELHRAVQMLKGEAAGTLALLRTPRCSLDPSVTQSIRTLAMSLLKRKPANEHIHTDLAPSGRSTGSRTSLGLVSARSSPTSRMTLPMCR